MSTDHQIPMTTRAKPAGRSPMILVVGDAMLDRYLDGAAERISPEAPVPVLQVRRSFERPGGAANVAANVAALGGTPTLVAVVGADPAAERLRAVLGESGASPEAILATRTIRTTVKTRLLAGHSQIARFDEESAFTDTAARADLLAVVDHLLPRARLAVISDYAKGVCDGAVCRGVIEGAARIGIPVIVDPKGIDFTRYAGAAVITPNRAEAAAVCGFAIRDSDDAIRAGRAICERYGIAAAVVTLGEQGMVIVAGDRVAVIPTQARRVFDVTGAGDTAVAMLAVSLAEGTPLEEACFLANAAAGLQVGRVGTSRISRSEVEDAIASQSAAARGKVLDIAGLRRAVRQARAEGKRIGFTNGCFDILHHGHVALLEAAAKECDLLVVGVNSDASVRRLKGAPRPFVPAAARQAVLAALSSVAWVCEFEGDTPLELIEAVEPDVLVKGADYRPDQVVGADLVLARGGRVVTPLFVQNVSTTNIVDRILASQKGMDRP
jgi:D-beta-D-heptose 7-phosphate kinase/D-beta-D-heptose 1-phosphate adenosyltransferase